MQPRLVPWSRHSLHCRDGALAQFPVDAQEHVLQRQRRPQGAHALGRPLHMRSSDPSYWPIGSPEVCTPARPSSTLKAFHWRLPRPLSCGSSSGRWCAAHCAGVLQTPRPLAGVVQSQRRCQPGAHELRGNGRAAGAFEVRVHGDHGPGWEGRR